MLEIIAVPTVIDESQPWVLRERKVFVFHMKKGDKKTREMYGNIVLWEE